MDEETYVVRIPRRAHLSAPVPRAERGRRRHDQIGLSGVIEDAEIGERRVSHDIEKLRVILPHTVSKDPQM